MSESSNFSTELVFTHLAVIAEYMASCITFRSPNRVPAGNNYHVCNYCVFEAASKMIVAAWCVFKWG